MFCGNFAEYRSRNEGNLDESINESRIAFDARLSFHWADGHTASLFDLVRTTNYFCLIN